MLILMFTIVLKCRNSFLIRISFWCTGRAYNTWPLMDGQVMPVKDMFPLEPAWRNFFETTATVQVRSLCAFGCLKNATHQVVSSLFLDIQFDHRTLALGTLGAVSAMYAAAVRSPHFKALPAASRRALHHVVSVRTVHCLHVQAFFPEFLVGVSLSKKKIICCSSARSNSANCFILF